MCRLVVLLEEFLLFRREVFKHLLSSPPYRCPKVIHGDMVIGIGRLCNVLRNVCGYGASDLLLAAEPGRNPVDELLCHSRCGVAGRILGAWNVDDVEEKVAELSFGTVVGLS